MRHTRMLAAGLLIVSTVFVNGCCCVRRVCDWARRPFCRRYDPAPQFIAPITSPCAPMVETVPAPQPMNQYESLNQ